MTFRFRSHVKSDVARTCHRAHVALCGAVMVLVKRWWQVLEISSSWLYDGNCGRTRRHPELLNILCDVLQTELKNL